MNIAYDYKTCALVRAQADEEDTFPEVQLPLDWQDLRARLFAAHEIRAVLDAETKPLRLRLRGSFDGCAASAITTYEGASGYVNPTASTYGKPGENNVSPVAGPSNSGRRG
ncbi:hypothetical protein [Novosphingobium sp.]|uniref:hypothetical protein n=1 Tax=Novosphingobium sp. TaxID=1874826 RepID=UPI002B48249A|nr:hypothetical protein [Novosphingobium sp.]HKR93391.1 hypothetical protein [Novosphingobium sp.]